MRIRVNDVNDASGANGVDLAYDDHGMGLPVIFLHAFPLNRSMWEGQITALLNEQRYRLVSLDWRGLGESDINTAIVTIDMLADDVVGLMDALGMQQAILCGLSMGGYVAFALLRKYPQRVRGLVLADTRPGTDSEEGKANREKLAVLAESEGTSAVADLQLPRLISDYTRQQHPEVELRIRRMIDTATPHGIAAISRGMALRSDATDVLASISSPTLVIVGEHDTLAPPDVAHSYAAQIANAQIALIPHAGHISNMEQPDVFLEVMSRFLQTLS